MTHADDLLSPRDAGRRLGLTTSGIIRLALVGALPEVRDSAGRRLFLAKDVERVARERELRRGARVGERHRSDVPALTRHAVEGADRIEK